jgi:hypothetical protein
VGPGPHRKVGPASFVKLHWKSIGVGMALAVALLFYFPLDYTVGGEAVISPWERHLAFCKSDGLIEKTLVTEGSRVQKNQILAVLEPTELKYKIDSAERQAEILARKVVLLSREADTTPAKLGERKIIELERQKALEDLQYLKWQSQFLEIRAPVSGVLLTKDVESLAGKKLRAGEPFCEIVPTEELTVEIFLPEDGVDVARKGQTAYVYLNHDPIRGYKLRVEEIAPAAEAVPRLGNICRIKAKFGETPREIKVGMKGVGKIHTGTTSVYSIVKRGILVRWTRLSLYF